MRVLTDMELEAVAAGTVKNPPPQKNGGGLQVSRNNLSVLNFGNNPQNSGDVSKAGFSQGNASYGSQNGAYIAGSSITIAL